MGQALLDLAPRVGFAVTLLAFGARSGDFPQAHKLLDSVEDLADGWGQGGLVVVATQGKLDIQALEAALSVMPSQCWFVASERKARILKDQLIETGQNAARVEAIVSPAGQRIGAQTAEEIALAVLASVIAAKRSQEVKTNTLEV